jgi:prepilin-type N-terminal cleavage/methylation domain-containing protein
MFSEKNFLPVGKRGDRGFTLIEVLVATAIFAVALLGLAIGATTVIRNNQISYFTTIATNLAQDKLEELKAKTVASLPSCPSYATTGCSNTSTAGGLTFTREWQILVNQPVSGVNQIDIRVTWTDYSSHTVTVSSAVKQ